MSDESQEGRELPTVSVLLPAWNEAAMIACCLDSLLAIDRPELEIIVCAGGTDDTLALAQRYASERVTVLEQQAGEGKQAALRRCFAASHGAIIYLTDADCIVPAASFRRVLQPILDKAEQVVTGDSRPLEGLSRYRLVRYQHYVDSAGAQRLGNYVVGLHGRNAALTRSTLATVGAFAWPAPTGTDYALAEELHRHNYPIRHVVEAEVLSDYPVTVSAYVRQRSRWLRNLLLIGYRYRRWSLVLPTLASSILLSILAIGSVLVLVRGYRSRHVVALAWVGLGLKRGVAAASASAGSASPDVVAIAVGMTPIEVWIRLRSLIQLCGRRARWCW